MLCRWGRRNGAIEMSYTAPAQHFKNETKNHILVWRKVKQGTFFEEEFRELEKKYKNFSFYVALSQPEPEDHWDGMIGYIHQFVYDEYLEKHEDPDEIEYYLCGPPPMIDAIEEMLDSLGVEPEMISYDKF